MRIHYDPTEDALYIRLSEASYAESEEVGEGIILDRDKTGALTGIELLNASTRVPQLNTEEFKYEILPSAEKSE